ncbi:hypothetical protein Dimus_032427 [Dionaea muscipula]
MMMRMNLSPKNLIWSYLLLVHASNICLPKGVIRGCPECSDCQKVIARWTPEQACKIFLKEAPSFHPDEEEFMDTLKYIESISKQVERYGLCRIVPPPSWNPPSLMDSVMWHSSTFISHIQRVHELQCCSKRKSCPSDNFTRKKKKSSLKPDSDNEIENVYTGNLAAARCNEVKDSESKSAPQFNLQSFKKYADYFKKNYFSIKSSSSGSDISGSSMQQERKELSEEDIEGEYWRIVENPTEEIEVLCGSNLDARSFGSGFPVPSKTEASASTEHPESSWNLNNTSRLPGSFLAFERTDTSSILSPQLHVGMCFSSLPWKVEENHLYALYYLHLGDPRIWYGIPGSYSYKFEAVVKKYFPDMPGQHSQLLHKLVLQLSPTTLTSEGIPVYRCIQQSREFLLFLPRVYYSGFDCGFNCSESAVFAPLDWLPHGQNVLEIYREQRRKTLLSHDKILLRAANEAVETQWEILLKGKKATRVSRWKDGCGKDGILAKALKLRIKSEARQREYLSVSSQSRKMDENFDATGKKECVTCYCDLYLSVATCACNPNRYSCLRHAKHLCPCAWSEKIFLFRYEIGELDVLAEAIEGRYSAIHRWVKENLGLALDLNLPRKSPSSSNPAVDSPFVDGSSGADNHEAKTMCASSDDGNVDAIEKLILEAKKRVIEETSFWDDVASGQDEHEIDLVLPGDDEKVDSIEKLLLDAKKRILEQVPLDDDSISKGVSLEGAFPSNDSSEEASSSSSSSLKSDGEGSVLGLRLGKSGSSAPVEKEKVVVVAAFNNGSVDCIEVDSTVSSPSNPASEEQLKVRSPSGESRDTVVYLSDEEDGS